MEHPALLKSQMQYGSDGQPILCVQLQQDLKMENAHFFENQFSEAFEEGNCLSAILDFSKVRFVDSSGLGALISCAEKIKRRQGKCYIGNLNHSTKSVFKLAGLNRVFQLLDSKEFKQRFAKLRFET